MSTQKNISSWIEKGKGLMYSGRHEEWARCVNIRANDFDKGLDVSNALDVMQLLENGGSFKQASSMIDSQNHSGSSYSMLMSMIVTFSKQGPAFYRYLERDIPKETEEYIAKIERENKQFEAEEQASQPSNE